jgi:hypothetical protein
MSLVYRPWFALIALVGLTVAAPVSAADLDSFLPDDTEVAFTINFKQILESPLFKKHAIEQLRKSLDDNDEAKQMFKALGLDPLTDVHSLTIVAPNQQPDDKKFTMIVRGNFDRAKIDAAADKFIKDNPDKLKFEKKGDLRIYEAKGDAGEDRPPLHFAVVTKEAIVLSTLPDYVTDAAGKAAGNKVPGIKSKELRELIGKIDGKQSMWMAGIVSEEVSKQAAAMIPREDIANIIGKLRSISGGITLGDGVDFELVIQTADPKTGKELRKTIEIGQTLAVVGVTTVNELKDYADVLKDIIKDAKIQDDGKGAASLKIRVPGKVIDEAMKNLPSN